LLFACAERSRSIPIIPFGSRNASEDAELFFGQAIQKIRCIALATELFFEEAWAEKSEQIGRISTSKWCYFSKEIIREK
jgi:hypothetical protein